MPKTKILFVVGLTSLIIMACSISGYSQQKNDAQSTHEMISGESKTPLISPPKETSTSLPTEEISPAKEFNQANVDEPTIMIENTPTPTVDPLSSKKSCLAKTWEINGLSDYVVAAVPPELAEQYSLEYVDTTGRAFLTLSPEDEIILHAENLEFLFNARYTIFEVPVTVRIDGTAAGTYNIDTTTLVTSNMDTSGMTASAKALNEDLIEPPQIIDSIPLIRPPFNTAEYSCLGDTLELELSGYKGDLPPLSFQAVQ